MYQTIYHRAYELENETIALRRKFHQMPETAWQESETSAAIADILKTLGYEVITEHVAKDHSTGVIGQLHMGEGPIVALRFDIDGLANQETCEASHLPNREGFSSKRDGFMHACGHDGHISIGLSTARILSELKDSLIGTIRLIFQPAEEGCMGARAVVANGWLDDVDYFMAGHIVPRSYVEQQPNVEQQADRRVSDPGPASNPCDAAITCGSLATTKINVSFTGHSCHGATPEKGTSTITAIAAIIQALNSIPRHSEGATFLNIGKIQAGEGRNIVAETGYMELEVRGETTALNQYMESHALRILNDMAELYGCKSHVDVLGSSPSIESSPELYRPLCQMWEKEFPDICLAPAPVYFQASEDAPLMMERVKSHGGKALYVLLPTDATASLHKPAYDFSETILTKAVILYCSGVCGILSSNPDMILL